jgi:hypothetical protein
VTEEFRPSKPEAGARFAERRSSPRYVLVAAVDILDPVANIRLFGRTAEISQNGCYVDILNPLPKNSVIQLFIRRDGGTFETWARVVYVHDRLGMGMQFFNTTRDHAALLEKWIAELSSSGCQSS